MLTGTRSHGSTLIHMCLCHTSTVRACHTSRRVAVEHVIEYVPLECYAALNLTSDISIQDVKDTYIKLARKYHPDSNVKSSNAEKFAKINSAYNNIMNKMQQDELPTDDDDDDDDGAKEKNTPQLQHRRYLSYEGFGIGTMSQRAKQYSQYRVIRVTEKLHEHRVEQFTTMASSHTELMEEKSPRKLRFSNSIERVVEDLIQDAMLKGEFHNLPGSGKPFSFSNHNPMLDISTQILNKILINHGYTPNWILLRKDIINDIANLHSSLAKYLAQTKETDHTQTFDQFQIGIKDVNEKVNTYNMVVPILSEQMIHYNCRKELEKVRRNPQEFLGDISTSKTLSNAPGAKDAISWSQVWKDIKDVFR